MSERVTELNIVALYSALPSTELNIVALCVEISILVHFLGTCTLLKMYKHLYFSVLPVH